jgi:hypothetical protein
MLRFPAWPRRGLRETARASQASGPETAPPRVHVPTAYLVNRQASAAITSRCKGLTPLGDSISTTAQPRRARPELRNFLSYPDSRAVTWPNTAPPELAGAGAQVRAQAPAASGDDLAEYRLSWGYMWWQVLGSNQRRLSRRFYRPLPLATRATCLAPPLRTAQ